MVGCWINDQEVARSSPGLDRLCNNSRLVLHTHVPLSPSSIIWYWQKLGCKQAHHAMH